MTPHDSVRRVSWLELFFDLVFVAAVAQVASPLAERFDPSEIGRFSILFLLIWWAWLGQTMFATRFGGQDRLEPAFTFAQICAAAAMAVNSQGPLEGRDSAGFAAAYGVMRLLVAVQYARAGGAAVRPLTRRYRNGCLASAALWLASSVTAPPIRFVCWMAAGAIDAATPLAAEAHGARLPPHREHLPERFGLFTIILLGEAMAAVMRGMRQHETWPPAAALSVLSGLFIVFQLWWWYFHRLGVASPRRVRSRAEASRLVAWTYAHVPFYVGLVVLGVGFEHLIVSAAPVPHLALLAETAAACAVAVLSLALLGGFVGSSGHRKLAGQEADA